MHLFSSRSLLNLLRCLREPPYSRKCFSFHWNILMMGYINWEEIVVQQKDRLVLVTDYQCERHWQEPGVVWGLGFSSLKLAPQSSECNTACPRHPRRSRCLHKWDGQHISERYILFSDVLKYPCQRLFKSTCR